MSSRVAYRYAKALYDLSVEQNTFDAIAADIATVREAIAGSRELDLLLHSPIIDDRKKKSVITAVFEGKVGKEVAQFVELLVGKGRSADLPGILEAFQGLVDRRLNVAPATITTAVELDEATRKRVVQAVQEASGSAIRPTFTVDPSIIGGFRARFSDRMIDATVRHQLERLHETLMTRPMSEGVLS